MDVHISWGEGVWVVSFGVNQNLILETPDYKKAYFWKKYEKEIDPQFVLDYINNV